MHTACAARHGEIAGTNGDTRCGCAGASAALEKQPLDPNQANLLHAGSMSRTQQAPSSWHGRNTGTSHPAPPHPPPQVHPPPAQIFLPRHKRVLSGYASFSGTASSSPCLLKLLFIPQSIPHQPKRAEFNTTLDTQAPSDMHRASSFSRHRHHTGVSGRVPRGAL